MITEGEDAVTRQTARDLGAELNADYCYVEWDEHENMTIILKYGEFYNDDKLTDIKDSILGNE